MISNPVMQFLFAGVHLDVTAHPTGDGQGVALEVQFVRTDQEGPIRRVPTPWGALEVPELQVFRLRGGLIVPVGQTVLVGAQGQGPTRRALLLTSTITRTP